MTGVLKPTSGRIFIRDKEVDLDRLFGRHGARPRRSRRSTRTSRWARSSRCGATSSSAARSPTAAASSTSRRKSRSPTRSSRARSASAAPASPSIRPCPSSPAASARASPSAAPCTSTPTSSCSTSRRPRWRSRRCARCSTSCGASRQQGRACIYIEHNLAHVHEVADRLVVLDRGEIVSEIRPQDMRVARAHRISDRPAAQAVRQPWPRRHDPH